MTKTRSKVGDPIVIKLHGKVASKSRNLLGVFDYGRRHGIHSVLINQLWRSSGGRLQIRFDNGAITSTEFASYNVLVNFVKSRRTWPEARVVSRGASFRSRVTESFAERLERTGDSIHIPSIALSDDKVTSVKFPA